MTETKRTTPKERGQERAEENLRRYEKMEKTIAALTPNRAKVQSVFSTRETDWKPIVASVGTDRP